MSTVKSTGRMQNYGECTESEQKRPELTGHLRFCTMTISKSSLPIKRPPQACSLEDRLGRNGETVLLSAGRENHEKNPQANYLMGWAVCSLFQETPSNQLRYHARIHSEWINLTDSHQWHLLKEGGLFFESPCLLGL